MRVLVTGGTGFVGSRIVQALLARPGVGVRVLTRRAHIASTVEQVVGDLADTSTLERAVSGIDRIVHAAAAVQGADDAVEALNAGGTRRLMNAARQAGLSDIVYVSTTAVYGSGPHRGASESDLTPAPESVASRTRLTAEEAVLAAGGKVIRPALTYGVGDKWFVPSLIRGVSALGGLPDGGRARLSVIDVDLLAGAVAEVIARFDRIDVPILHAAHPRPVTVSAFLKKLTKASGVPLPVRSVPRDDAAVVAARLGFTSHQFALIADDHWYDASALWRADGVAPGGDAAFTPEQGAWYEGLATAMGAR